MGIFRVILQLFVDLLRGAAVGLANIIPGVSGGTMALILGIYERLIRAIRNIGLQTFLSPFRGWKTFVDEWRRVEATLLLTLAVGALGAIVAVAELLVYLLESFHDPTFGFFFGLVLVSVIMPLRMINKRSFGAVGAALIGAGLVIGLTLAMTGEQRVESARKRAAAKVQKEKLRSAAPAPTKAAQQPIERDGKTMLLFFISGAIAISAMILPGISGSFVLLLMGVYFDVLACVVHRELILLGIFSLGCLVGLIFFTRLIHFMLERFHDLTLAFLSGLVVGSLYAIWPFKTFAIVAGKRVDMDNALPAALGNNELLTLASAVAGCAIVGVFVWLEIRNQRAAEAVS